jgi:hypothetical protein
MPAAGLGADSMGVHWAVHWSYEIDRAAAKAGIEPIMLATGIAIQSQWSGSDSIDEIRRRNGRDSSMGIAQLKPSEARFFEDGEWSVFDENQIRAMGNKIKESVEACNGCTTTDKFIVAALAQNAFYVDGVRSLLRNADNSVNWNEYFKSLPTVSDSAQKIRTTLLPCKSWECFQLRMFVNDMLALRDKGWEIPSDVNINYMQCLADGRTDCKP